MKRCLGLSLVEVLATLFLFSIALAVIAQLLASTQRLGRFSQGQDRSIQAAVVTLAELRDEVKGSLTILSPAGAGAAPTLEITKPIPGVVRFPVPVPATPPAGWTLFPSTAQVTVLYQVADDELVRTSGLPASRQSVCQGISLLQTRLLAGGNVEIALVVRQQQKTQTLVTSVYRFR